MSTFNIGDIVRLKSGGPKMTVLEGGSDTAAQCQWFDRNGKLHTDSFPVMMLDGFVARDTDD